MDANPTPFEALSAAVEIVGSQSAMSRICNVGQPAVWKWLQSSKRLPAEHVLPVEAATGVSRHLLRPDIYPLEHGVQSPVLPVVASPPPLVVRGRQLVSQGRRARA